MDKPNVLVNVDRPTSVSRLVRSLAGKARFFQVKPYPPVPGCVQGLTQDTEHILELRDTPCDPETRCVDVSTLSYEEAVLAIADAAVGGTVLNSSAEPRRDLGDSERGPSLTQMAKTFSSAMVDFANSGFKRVTKEQHAARMEICNKCEFWDGAARFGMGKCNKCGCTGAKQWLASSTCPIGLWGSLVEATARPTTDAEYDQRLAICNNCEFWDAEGANGHGKCKQCGCATKYKLRKSDENCPIGKWQAVT